MSSPIHWADQTAERIIRQRGDKELYVLSSGITPSGMVHFGNFREVITVDFVARALKKRGKDIRFIFSWDNYDTLRKVPPNLDKQEELTKNLFKPIVDIPDPFDKTSSYAQYFQEKFEQELKLMGIAVEPIDQAQRYRNQTYNAQIKIAQEQRDKIIAILDKHRSTPLDKAWQPVSLYCENCHTDHKTDPLEFDGNTLSYTCKNCRHQGREEIKTSSRIKLKWRIDWPMRWAFEKVDFEPGGKDHSSQGGSLTTAKEIVSLFGGTPPVYLQYDFVSLKGSGGKMSSSKGNLVTVHDIALVYEPQIIRYIFASYKSNVDFSISLDLDVIKIYEDFDRMEKLALGETQGNVKKQAMAKRVYELSCLTQIPKQPPFRAPFRHLTNVLQIFSGDMKRVTQYYQKSLTGKEDEVLLERRAKCAWHWLQNYAPKNFTFSLNEEAPKLNLSPKILECFKKVIILLENNWEKIEDDQQLHKEIYKIMHELELKPAQFFPPFYQLLISKEEGPKLAGFIRIIGKEKVLSLLKAIS